MGELSGLPAREVFALFENENEARRHADASAYLFDVFPIVVYERREDCPPVLTMTDPGVSRRILAVLEDELEVARLMDEETERNLVRSRAGILRITPSRGGQQRTLHAVGSHEEWFPEVDVLCDNAAAAERHVDAAYPMMRVPDRGV